LKQHIILREVLLNHAGPPGPPALARDLKHCCRWGQPEGTIMADNKNKVGKQDRDRINVDEDYELSDWEKYFGVSRERLREAVKAAGPMVKDVDKWLKGHHVGK
jgi:hypothetical protein